MGNGKWEMGNGKWEIGNGKRGMGEWGIFKSGNLYTEESLKWGNL